MKFKVFKTKCPHCETVFDAYCKRCPQCQSVNKINIQRPGREGIVWMDTLRQGLMFLVGFLALNLVSALLSFIFSLALQAAYPDPEMFKHAAGSPAILMSLNILAYTIILIAVTLIAYPFLNTIFDQYKQGKSWLFGLAFGFILVGSSIGYGLILQLIPGLENLPINTNQAVISQMTIKYPLAAILVFGFAGPIVEEFTYRMGVFSYLSRFNRVVAYIVTMLVFGLIHFNFSAGSKDAYLVELINIPSYIIGGAILCTTYEYFGFGASSIAHITNNLVSVASILITNSIQ